ncbi:hypothetical protein ACLOJK_035160 [Asimina triloba]
MPICSIQNPASSSPKTHLHHLPSTRTINARRQQHPASLPPEQAAMAPPRLHWWTTTHHDPWPPVASSMKPITPKSAWTARWASDHQPSIQRMTDPWSQWQQRDLWATQSTGSRQRSWQLMHFNNQWPTTDQENRSNKEIDAHLKNQGSLMN